jgi:hypothetical protein
MTLTQRLTEIFCKYNCAGGKLGCRGCMHRGKTTCPALEFISAILTAIKKDVEGLENGKRPFSDRTLTYTQGYNQAINDVLEKLK